VALGGVHHHVALLQHAAIDAHEGQVAVLVVDDLEGEAGEGRVLAGRDHADLGAFLGALLRGDLDALDVHRARQVVHHGVEQGLHALVLEGRAAEHRAELA
jgi:hypothetical protein